MAAGCDGLAGVPIGVAGWGRRCCRMRVVCLQDGVCGIAGRARRSCKVGAMDLQDGAGGIAGPRYRWAAWRGVSWSIITCMVWTARDSDVSSTPSGDGSAVSTMDVLDTPVVDERSGLPKALAPWLQEYDIGCLDLERDEAVIIERTLEYGGQAEVRWLFRHYGEEHVRRVVADRGARHLSPRVFTFWRLVLDVRTWRPHPWPDATDRVWGGRG